MKYILHSKFEVGLFLDNTSNFSGGSYKVQLVFDNVLSINDKKNIDKLADYFDHSTVINENSNMADFIKNQSQRYILTNDIVSESTIPSIIFSLVSKYIVNNNLDITLLEVVSFNGKDETVIIDNLNSDITYDISNDTYNT